MRGAGGIRQVLGALAEEPRGPRFDLKALRAVGGPPPALRSRIGQYRIILRIDHEAKEIPVARVGHRKTIYSGLPPSYD